MSNTTHHYIMKLVAEEMARHRAAMVVARGVRNAKMHDDDMMADLAAPLDVVCEPSSPRLFPQSPISIYDNMVFNY